MALNAGFLKKTKNVKAFNRSKVNGKRNMIVFEYERSQ